MLLMSSVVLLTACDMLDIQPSSPQHNSSNTP